MLRYFRRRQKTSLLCLKLWYLAYIFSEYFWNILLLQEQFWLALKVLILKYLHQQAEWFLLA